MPLATSWVKKKKKQRTDKERVEGDFQKSKYNAEV